MVLAVVRYLRFLLGLGIVVWLFVGMPTLFRMDFFMAALVFLTAPPPNLLVYPALVVALYFIVSSRIRVRVDTVALVVAAGCLYGLYGLVSESELGANAPAWVPRLPGQKSFDIVGDAVLRVKAVTDRGEPVAGLEIAIGESPGGPSRGGVVRTDATGTANFALKPGSYYLGIGMKDYPKDVELPEFRPFRIVVEEGKTNEQLITLKVKAR